MWQINIMYGIELNLDTYMIVVNLMKCPPVPPVPQMPAVGAVVTALPVPVGGGSGAPARLVAELPPTPSAAARAWDALWGMF